MTAQTFNLTITADTVAWYGAVVSTVALAVSAINVVRDRARIVVSAQVGMRLMGTGGGYKPNTDYIVITVANRGRRPRTIEKVGFTYRTAERSQPVIAADSALKGPRELTEGRSSMWMVEQDAITADDIEEVWAYDQAAGSSPATCAGRRAQRDERPPVRRCPARRAHVRVVRVGRLCVGAVAERSGWNRLLVSRGRVRYTPCMCQNTR